MKYECIVNKKFIDENTIFEIYTTKTPCQPLEASLWHIFQNSSNSVKIYTPSTR